MQITDVKVRKLFDEGPMKAIVSVTFDAQLAVHDIKVIHARDKFFIVMPSRKNPDDTYRDIVHPINSQFRADLDEIIEAQSADGTLVDYDYPPAAEGVDWPIVLPYILLAHASKNSRRVNSCSFEK